MADAPLPLFDAPPAGPGARRRPTNVAGSVVEQGFVRRTRTLLRAAPVHALATKTAWQGWDTDAYDPRVLAMAAIDAVVARMGFSAELTYDDAVLAVAELAELAAPDRPTDEHFKVATYVVDGLLNDRDNNNSQAFSAPYSDYRNGHERRELRFFILVERTRGDGQTVLEASVDAINAFRGGLDLDVEDAQMAMELVLQAQLARGDLEEAEVTAEHNQRLSYEMRAKIRSLLDATRNDVGKVDWAEGVLADIAKARRHVSDRVHVEETILAHLSGGDETREEHLKETARRVALLLEGCLREHRALHEQLMGANGVFLAEQERQELRRRSHTLGLFSVQSGLLAPLLQLPVRSSADAGQVFVEASMGTHAPRLPRMSELVELLLKRRTTSERGVEPEDVPLDLAAVADDIEAFDDDTLRAARRVTAPCRQGPVLLSELLAEAADFGGDVEELVRLSVLWAYAPEHDDEAAGVAEVAAELFDDDIVAVPTGGPLRAGRWIGDEMLVGPAADLIADDDHDHDHDHDHDEEQDDEQDDEQDAGEVRDLALADGGVL